MIQPLFIEWLLAMELWLAMTAAALLSVYYLRLI
jgi:hypothetical protein